MMRSYLIRTGGAVFVVALCLFLTGGEARASHYPLVDLGLLADAELAALAKQKIQTSEELLPRVAGPRERAALLAALKREVKLTPARVKEWADWCDLLQVSGIGPTMVKLLRAAGVTNSTVLIRQKPAVLSLKLQAANEKESISGKTPSEEHLAGWIATARKLPVKVR